MHIMILGAGEIGYHTALSLSRENREVVLVESDANRADQIDDDDNDIQVVRGNAADPDVLLQAGVKDTDLVVAVTNSDEANIAACLFAARISPATRRVARIRQIDTRRHGPLLTGAEPVAHSLIHPEELCARKIGDIIRYPGTTDVNWFFGARAVLVSLPVTAASPSHGRTLREIGQERSARRLPFLVATLVHMETAHVPSAGDILQAGDTLTLATLSDRLDEVLTLFCPAEQLEPLHKVTVYGGGQIGLYLAEILEQSKRNIKVIEPDEARAAVLAERLRRSLVLCGDPADRGVFYEEDIAASDAFAAVTEDEEDNMIAALYAKSFGVRLAAATLRRPHLSPLVQRLGVDTVILPQQTAIGKILEHVRAGAVSSVIVLERQGMEVIETSLAGGSRLTGRPLRDLRMPKGSLLLALQRPDGTTIIPDGNVTLAAGDRVAVISRQTDVAGIESLLRGNR